MLNIDLLAHITSSILILSEEFIYFSILGKTHIS